MAYPNITSGNVMDVSASLMNDSAKSIYTYPVQLPYLNMAMLELQEFFELNDIPVTQDVTAVLTPITPAVDHLDFTTTPVLPVGFVEPQILWERQSGTNEPWIQMSRVEFLPRYMEGILLTQLLNYVWESQAIRFFPPQVNIDIKMNYTKTLFPVPFSDITGADIISIINAQSFLQNRTAALCALYVGENPTRAKELDDDAALALDRVMGIGTRTKQSFGTRHRPFRSGFKRRTYM